MKRLLLIGLAALFAQGCFAFHDDYPDQSCSGNADCFVSQGEECNLETNMCVPAADAAPPADGPVDAAPLPDATVSDAALPDAAVNDAAIPDARVNDAM